MCVASVLAAGFANDGEKGEAFGRGEREKRGRKESLGLNFE